MNIDVLAVRLRREGAEAFAKAWRNMLSRIATTSPAPVLTTALYERFSSRGAAEFQNKLMSAMRLEFGGHHEQPENK